MRSNPCKRHTAQTLHTEHDSMEESAGRQNFRASALEADRERAADGAPEDADTEACMVGDCSNSLLGIAEQNMESGSCLCTH